MNDPLNNNNPHTPKKKRSLTKFLYTPWIRKEKSFANFLNIPIAHIPRSYVLYSLVHMILILWADSWWKKPFKMTGWAIWTVSFFIKQHRFSKFNILSASPLITFKKSSFINFYSSILESTQNAMIAYWVCLQVFTK